MKVPDSIETRLLKRKPPKLRKGVKEEMNGGESEKKGEEVLEFCETGESIPP